jgi:hypothetical protein
MTQQAAENLEYALRAASGDKGEAMQALEAALRDAAAADKVGRCRLTVSKPVLKAPMVSATDTNM